MPTARKPFPTALREAIDALQAATGIPSTDPRVASLIGLSAMTVLRWRHGRHLPNDITAGAVLRRLRTETRKASRASRPVTSPG